MIAQKSTIIKIAYRRCPSAHSMGKILSRRHNHVSSSIHRLALYISISGTVSWLAAEVDPSWPHCLVNIPTTWDQQIAHMAESSLPHAQSTHQPGGAELGMYLHGASMCEELAELVNQMEDNKTPHCRQLVGSPPISIPPPGVCPSCPTPGPFRGVGNSVPISD